MHKMPRFAAALLSLLPTVAPAQTPATPIQDFFRSYFEEQLKDQPENATNVYYGSPRKEAEIVSSKSRA